MTTQKTVTVEDVTKWYGRARLPHGKGVERHDCEPCRALESLRDTAAQVPALQGHIGKLEIDISGHKGVIQQQVDHIHDLQARVAELTTDLARYRRASDAINGEWDKTVSERDALRAQVETMRGHTCSFGCVDTEHLVVQRQDVERGEVAREQMRELADFLDCGEEKVVRRVKEKYAALSTPPAEAKTAEGQCPKCGHPEHWDVGAANRAPHSYCIARSGAGGPNCGCTHRPA
jgi:hypothetical protein